jgi:putative hydrolase of the HAD superfamily
MSKYDHLFFDLDHTLWDFENNAKDSMIDIFHEFEVNKITTSDFNDFYEKYSKHNKLLWDRYQKGFISADELKWKRMWRTLLDFKVADEVLAKDMGKRFLEILPNKQSVFPYTIEILNYLSEKKYQLHLITNGFEKTQRSKIKNSKIDHFFSHIITSESSNSMKPEKEIFQYAIQQANTDATKSIMIGDNLEADIKGAIDFGMDCIFVNHINAETNLNPTFTITHLKELETIF